jgi:hypothetical protein
MGHCRHATANLLESKLHNRNLIMQMFRRFPLYGQYFADGLPNFPHTGAAATALHRMLVQKAGQKIVLLPAWPKTWDADFKLHLSHETLVYGQVKEGQLVGWSIQPEERRKDVVVAWESNAPASPRP